ncbi:hypothetical protein PG994_001065 [Apiospora phragmitis]|uniref:Uncharacterized protein n=1 Tax=Apiospora phragmitis TaxID=2905665 RepID=A0ABR1WSG3_9PEZI
MEQTQVTSPVQGQQDAAPTQPAPAAKSPPQQHPASYPSQHGAAQPFQQPAPYYAYGASPRVVPFDKTWYWAKIALTVASIVFAVILLGLSLGLALNPHSGLYDYGYEFIIVPLVIACVIWDLAELITVCLPRRRRPAAQQQQQQQQQQTQTQGQQPQQDAHHRQGIHPGAHVGVDLVLWLAGIVTLLFSIAGYFETGYLPYECDDYANSSYYHTSSYYDEQCGEDYLNTLKNFYIPAKRAVLAFICLLTITHFVIFVRGCIETNQRNRMRGPVIMVPAQHLSMYLGPQQPGMMPMMTPQTYMAPGQGTSTINEKAAAHATQPESNTAPAEGFYAPNHSSTGHVGQAV